MSNTVTATHLPAFYLNEIGGRSNLEDAISPQKGEGPNVFIVCDGVGGNSAGEVASSLAAEAFYQTFHAGYVQLGDEKQFKALIKEALLLFQSRVNEFITANPAAKNTSTTLTLAVIKDGRAFIAWCGDSRVYHVRDGQVLYRTADHSLVQELVSTGVISEAEAETHPQKNVILRSLNASTKLEDISVATTELKQGDWLLLCTDGLLEQFTERQFPLVLGRYQAGYDYAAAINELCKGKTRDNYSMYLVNYQEEQITKKNRLPLLIGVIVVVALVAIAFQQFAGKNAPDNKLEHKQADNASESLFHSVPEGRPSLFIDKGQDTLIKVQSDDNIQGKKEKQTIVKKDTVAKKVVPVIGTADSPQVNKPDSL